METPEIYYKRVYIKSGADLPKENGIYACQLHPIAYDRGDGLERLKFNSNNQQHINYWEKNINWYLLPIESKEITPMTDEQIELFIKSLGWECDGTSEVNDMIKVAKWMRDRQGKGIDLREELIKFTPFVTEKYHLFHDVLCPLRGDPYADDTQFKKIDKVVDEYLSRDDKRKCDHCGSTWKGNERCPECFPI